MRYEWVEIRPYIGVFLCVFNTLRDRMGERSGYPIKPILCPRKSGPTQLWVGGIVFTDEAIDGGLEIDEGMEDTVLEPAPREFGKEALDGIEPRTRGWRESGKSSVDDGRARR